MTAGELYPIFVNRQPCCEQNNSIVKISEQLHGMGLAVKDLFDVAGIPTSAGNPDWLATHPVPSSSHSSIVKLMQHGAHYLGKTLTDELAYSLNGSNIHYPKLVNPITEERLAGGSSSGSAVAVASNLADIGLGTDTGGSIRVPASYNGLFGIRTTHGAIDCDNMVALAPCFDTVGWMTQSLKTLQKVAKILLPENPVVRKKKYKIALVQNVVEQSEQKQEIENWIAALPNVECSLISLDTESYNTSETFRILQGHAIWQQHGEWINNTKPKFAQDIESRFMWCKSISEKDYLQACQAQQKWCDHINTIVEQVDALVIPTTPGRSPLLSLDAQALDQYRTKLMSFTAIAGLAGLPQLHLPLFSIESAPCGLSLIGAKHQDLSIINLASTLLNQKNQ